MATLLAAGTAVLMLGNADMSGCPACISRTVQGIPWVSLERIISETKHPVWVKWASFPFFPISVLECNSNAFKQVKQDKIYKIVKFLE